jgi:hypothetical protein
MQPRPFFYHLLARVEKWRAGITGEPGAREAGALVTGNQTRDICISSGNMITVVKKH